MDILKQSISMSIKNIRTNKMRSFLTTLGIIIGVTAVIALITIVHGVYDSVMGQFSELGANTITVSVTGNAMKTGISDSDIENIEALKYVNGTSPSVTTTATVMYEGSKTQLPYRAGAMHISEIQQLILCLDASLHLLKWMVLYIPALLTETVRRHFSLALILWDRRLSLTVTLIPL